MRIFLIILGLVFLLFSCEKEVFQLNEDISIGYNSTIHISTEGSGNLDVKYTELLNESRCPPGVNCVWAGFVKVKLQLDEQQYVELGLGETTVDSVIYNDRVIKLLAVDYDSDDDFGNEKKSSVVIRVN